MADDNRLTSADTSMYPRFQPMPQVNPLAQVNELINLQHNVQGVQQQQLQLGMGRLNYMHQQLGALAAKVDPKTGQPNASMGDVQGVIGSLVDAGVPQWQVQKELQKFQGKDAAGIQDLARQHMAQIADHAAAMGMAYGVPGTIDQGNVIQPTVRNPYTQAVTPAPGPNYGMGTSPSQRIAPHQVVGPGGNVINTTVGQSAAASGLDPVSAVPLKGAFTPSTPQGYSGPQPQLLGKNIDAYTEDKLAAQPMAKVIRDSSIALQLADKLGTTGTGPGTGVINDVRATMESLGITAPNDLVSMRNELDKYLAKNIQNSPLASRSDMAQIQTKLSEPNTQTQTNKATRDLLKSKISQAGMDIATPYAYSMETNPYGYLDHKGKFTQSQDQGAYAIAQGLADPVEAAKKITEMRNLPADNSQRKKFFDSLTNAKKAGLWNLPGTTNAPGQ